MSENSESTASKIDDAIHSNDQPLGKTVPGAPFAVVGLSYLLALLAVTAVIGFCAWLY